MSNVKERREKHIQTLIDMKDIMFESENWENLLDWIHAVIAGGMALQRINREDFEEDMKVPERKKGEWIEDGYYGLPCVCSYCGIEGKREWKYCPNCGARMQG